MQKWILLFLILMAQLNQLALAEYRQTEDRGRGNSQGREAHGSRGCPIALGQLKLIDPPSNQDEIRVTSTQPTLKFEVTASTERKTQTIRVSLTHAKEIEPIFDQIYPITGETLLEIPIRQPLQPQQTYILTAGILCDGQSISAAKILRTVLTVQPSHTQSRNAP